jgi:HSP20 family molecular chaperone IbpA
MTTLFQERFFPTDLLFRNFFDGEASFRGLQEQKPSYPVDVFLQEDELCFDIACVGLEKSDIDITIESNTLKVAYKKPSVESNPSDVEAPDYIHKGIARRSFDMGWKVSPKFDLTKIKATMANGLLKVRVPLSEESKPKAVTIK